MIARFLAADPGVSVGLELSAEAVDLIGQGFDLAVRGAVAVEPSLVTRQVGPSPIVVCAAPAHLAARGTPARPEDLAAQACLRFKGLRWGRVWHFERDGQSPRVPIVPRLEANDGPTLLQAAVAGAGITLEPAFGVGPAVRAGQLVPVLAEWTVADVPLHAVYPGNHHIAHTVRRFVGLLAEAFAKRPDLQAHPWGRMGPGHSAR